MACTSSIGPGATNMVTAAAVAHVNRLPVLLLPGDTFANRRPDPVLQQVEDFANPNVTANDCFRPVSRYWDRVNRPEQLLSSLPAAIDVLTDPAQCGPVTLALPEDVQTEAADFPARFFEPRLHRLRRSGPDAIQLKAAAACLAKAKKPLIVAGGGVHYSLACGALADFARKHRLPVAETQAGKGALPWNHPCAVGAIGVTGTSAANRLAAEADVVIAMGTRLGDFTTASRTVFQNPDVRIIALNVASFDAAKHGALPLVADARRGMEELSAALANYQASSSWAAMTAKWVAEWNGVTDRVTAPTNAPLPSDAQVLGAVNRQAGDDGVVVCAAGGLPGELHKLWRAANHRSYHVEYGYSCMGYEIAGGLGVKMAMPEREVFVLVGDGSYLMMNSEIATAVAMDKKLIIVVLDNHGYGCINRLQQACGGESFNNLWGNSFPRAPAVDFAAHAKSLGATAEKAAGIAGLEAALKRARKSRQTHVIVIDTDPAISTAEGGAWWDVPVPETSDRPAVKKARAAYIAARSKQRIGE